MFGKIVGEVGQRRKSIIRVAIFLVCPLVVLACDNFVSGVVCRKSSGNFETAEKWSILPFQVGIGGAIGREIAKERRGHRRASNCG